MSSWLAIGLCIAPILFGFIGWKTEPDAPANVASKPANENVSQPTESVFRETSSVKQSSPITVNVQEDNDIWRVIHKALNEPKTLAA
jgi:hypothetical protein